MKKLFPLYFLKTKPWDPSKKLDLAICYTKKKQKQLCTILFDRLGDKRRFHFSKTLKKSMKNHIFPFMFLNPGPGTHLKS